METAPEEVVPGRDTGGTVLAMIRQQAAARAGEKSGMLPPLAVRKSNVIERNLYHVAFFDRKLGGKRLADGRKDP